MKKIKLLVIGMLSTFALMVNVNAATANISVKANSTRILVGNTVKVTVNINSQEPLGSWEYSLNYDKSIMQLVSSDVSLHYAFVASNGNTKSVSYAYTFKALKSGSSKFSVSASAVIGWDEVSMGINPSSVTVNVITQEQLQESYSKDNYLKSLGIENLTLTPEFNKETLTYSIELEPLTTSINLIGTKNDSKSTISGLGFRDLSVGLNKLDIVVTAQNGSKRTYIINATVKELKPIIVNLDDQEFTVLRSLDGVNIPKTYIETKVSIQNEEVISLHNEVVDYTLVALKNKEGEIKLYLYDIEKNLFEEYKYIEFGSLSIRILEPKKELENYEKTTQIINDQEITALKINDKSSYSLIYGLNLETGKENYYSFDNQEDTLQRYSNEEVKTVSKDIKDYTMLTLVFASSSVILLLMLIITLARKPKQKNINSIIEKSKPKEKPKKEILKEKKNKEKKKKTKDKLDEWIKE